MGLNEKHITKINTNMSKISGHEIKGICANCEKETGMTIFYENFNWLYTCSEECAKAIQRKSDNIKQRK